MFDDGTQELAVAEGAAGESTEHRVPPTMDALRFLMTRYFFQRAAIQYRDFAAA
jgi:hypothetical protein